MDSMSNIERASELLREGRVAEAVNHLRDAGLGGDAAAWVELALWFLQGNGVVRDLRVTRDLFGRAAALGDRQARMVHLSLIANGTGGTADWGAALRLLREAARDDAAAAREIELIAAMDVDERGDPNSIPAARLLQNQPATHLFAGLLSRAECDAVAAAARPTLAPSVVIHPETGQAIAHPVRTSDNAAFPWVAETPFLHAINRRLAAASKTDVAAGEPLQVLRYRPGQEYKPHFDAIAATDNQRVLTMIAYLNTGYEGGETLFITSGLRVSGTIGDVLMFRNADADGRPDPHSQHAGLPVTRGEKLIASRWIRQYRFGPI